MSWGCITGIGQDLGQFGLGWRTSTLLWGKGHWPNIFI